MKETEFNPLESTEIVDQVKQEKQNVLVNRLHPRQGHKCFQYNALTNELSYAKFTESSIDFESAMNGNITPRRRVDIQDNCMYVTALNFKNAVKHLSRIIEKKIEPVIVH
jgi:hypothetical protein